MAEDGANARGGWRKEDYRNERNINYTIHEEIVLNVAGTLQYARRYTPAKMKSTISKTARSCYAQPLIGNALGEFFPLQCYTRLL